MIIGEVVSGHIPQSVSQVTQVSSPLQVPSPQTGAAWYCSTSKCEPIIAKEPPKKCPHCGVDSPGVSGKDYLVGIIVLALIIWAAWSFLGGDSKKTPSSYPDRVILFSFKLT